MDKFDESILASCDAHWRKVAMVIMRAHAKGGFADDDGCYEVIAERIGELVRSGKLEAQGDLENWRGSEVRLST